LGNGSRKISSYDKNVYLEKRFAKTIKGILGMQFITQDKISDQEEGTDFLIFAIEPSKIRVAARLRRYDQYIKDDYRNQFTIRWSLPSGNKTEIDKIRDGFVRYLFYGFVDEKEEKLIQYFIGDLLIFRLQEPAPTGIYPNNPLDSYLAAFRINDLPKEFIIKFWIK